MSAVTVEFVPTAKPHNTARPKVRGGVAWLLLGWLDRFMPPIKSSSETELPQEWFKYPPV